MFDFKRIATLIPPQGHVSFTITAGRNDRLVVLVQPIYPAIEELTGEKKEDYQRARVPMVLEGTPEELNNDFIRILEETEAAEGNLQRAFLAKQEAIDKAISTTGKRSPQGNQKTGAGGQPGKTEETAETASESKDFSLFK
ncbi:MAG: PRTRC system protein E [Nitrospiria bacterium]